MNPGDYSAVDPREVYEYLADFLYNKAMIGLVFGSNRIDNSRRNSDDSLSSLRLACVITNNQHNYVLKYAKRCTDDKVQLENAILLLKVLFLVSLLANRVRKISS